MLYILDIMQVTFVTESIVDLPTTGLTLRVGGGRHVSENEQCYKEHAYSLSALSTQEANGEFQGQLSY